MPWPTASSCVRAWTCPRSSRSESVRGRSAHSNKGAHSMTYEVAECRDHIGEWRAEASDDEGCYVVIFSGPNAERRARDYAAWQNAKHCPRCGALLTSGGI